MYRKHMSKNIKMDKTKNGSNQYSIHLNAFQTNVWPRDNLGSNLIRYRNRNLFAGIALA